MTPPSNPKLDVKADNYYTLVRQRLGLQADEKIKKAELIAMLEEMGMKIYESPDGTILELNTEKKLKASKKKDGDELTLEDDDDDPAK